MKNQFEQAVAERNVVKIGEFANILFGKDETFDLQSYFDKNMKDYGGVWFTNDVGKVLPKFNNYLELIGMETMPTTVTESSTHLIPFGNLLLNVELVVPVIGGCDEHYDYHFKPQYILTAEYFIMNDKTKNEDVDLLINFLQQLN